MDIRALRKIRHDGKLYCHGESIKKVKKEDAERLISMGAAEELQEKQNEKNNQNEQDQVTEEDKKNKNQSE